MTSEQPESLIRTDALAERLQQALGEAYVLERELGGGGMSRVFLAHEVKLGRPVVIKTLPEEVAEGISRERFRREVMLSANLQHPHIVGVLDAGDVNGLPFFVMPYVEGETLRARLAREGTLAIPQAVSIMRDVARALAFAHDRGVVHRDIKPDNVLLAHGSALVADFGVAKAVQTARAERRAPTGRVTPSAFGEESANASAVLTSMGTSLGTPAYMAPEQVAGEPGADHRADLYALGATAYEMLTARPPVSGRTATELLTATLVETPDPPSRHRAGIPRALEQVLLRCLEKDPAKRPQTAEELITLLENPSVVSGTLASTQVARVRSVVGARRLRLLIAAVALVVAGGSLALLLNRGRNDAASRTQPAAAAARASTVAVLPLVSVSPDSGDNYIALGMTDEITSALTRVPGLKVASRSAAAAAQADGGGVTEMATRLGVAFLLEGTVQREGKRLRVTARLVNGGDGFTAWSDVFEQTTDDLLRVQTTIANEIAAAIRGDLTGAPADSANTTTVSGTRDLDAYNEFLRGHFLLERRGESLRPAIDAFRAAITRDSMFGRAWAELAQAYALLPLHSDASRSDVWPLAERAARRALAIDSTLAPAYAALGNIYNGDLRWQEGRAALERAIRLDSSYAAAYQWLGENLLLNGDIDGARRFLEQAVRRDPGSTISPAVLAIALGIAGQTDSAIAKGRDAVARDPELVAARVMLGTVYAYANRGRDAARELEAARAAAPGLPLVLGALGHAYALAGDRNRALGIADTLRAMSARNGAASALAKVQLGLGDTAGALSSLERAVAARDPFFSAEPMASPIFSPVRGDPRFARIVAAAGLDVSRLTTAKR